MTEFRLFVSHAQIAVFHSDLQNPFNDWTDQHVAQGFSWRPGSVSFRSLAESGVHSISVEVVDRLEPPGANALRAVEVPFEVPESGRIEVSSISDTMQLSLTPGAYLLRCEFLTAGQDEEGRVSLKFSRGDAAHFAISRTDSTLKAASELLTTAEPASA